MALTTEQNRLLSNINHYVQVVIPDLFMLLEQNNRNRYAALRDKLAHVHDHVHNAIPKFIADLEKRNVARNDALLTAIKAIGTGGGGATAQQIAEAVADEQSKRLLE